VFRNQKRWCALKRTVSKLAPKGVRRRGRITMFSFVSKTLGRPRLLHCHETRSPYGCRTAFTLLEILVVIAIIAILASLLLPVLSSGKSKGKRVACSNNLRQFAASSQMYTADNDGKLVDNLPIGQGTNFWVPGNMTEALDATNQA